MTEATGERAVADLENEAVMGNEAIMLAAIREAVDVSQEFRDRIARDNCDDVALNEYALEPEQAGRP